MKRIWLLFFPLMIAGPIVSQPDSGALKTYYYGNFQLIYNDHLAVVHNNSNKRASLLFMTSNTFSPTSATSGEIPEGETTSYSMLSIVGPVVSYSTEWYAEGGAHPSYGTTFQAIDIGTGKPVSLLSYFSEEEILHAFLADSILRKTLQENRIVHSLKDFFASADGGCEMYISEDMLSHFAFHHTKNNQVAVRIGLSHGCEVNRGNFTQIGFYLKIPSALVQPLREAQKSRTMMGSLYHKK